MRRFALFAGVALLYAAALGRDQLDDWVASAELPTLQVDTSVEVLDQSTNLLRAYTVADGRWRLAVALPEVDPSYVKMLIAYEDKRFYTHSGVDPIAMLRALGQAAWNGRVISGGSTLTMQVARLLEDGPTGSFDGKLRQIRVALALERRLSKTDILEIYLNRAPFGGNLEGVRAASRAYFGKEPRRLTTAEAALLVALPQSPETRRPDRFYGNAVNARLRVLHRLKHDVLSAETVQAAVSEPVPRERSAFPALAPHLADRITTRAPAQQTYRTSIDGPLQRKLEALAQRAVRGSGARVSVAILVADHQTGAILSSVGSARYQSDARQGFVDMTRAIRSPGSTLKPLVYGLAFDQSLAHPETLIDDRPVAFGSYAPQNFDGMFRGTLRVRDALKQSLNIPVVLLTEALGPARLLSHLRRAGVEARFDGAKAGLAIALGGAGVSLHDLVQLYAAIANGGRPVQLSAVGVQTALSQPVLSPVAAWHIGEILSDIPAPPSAWQNGVAYKTGTSYGHRDAWAIGYDGRHVIGVWMGRPDGTPVPGAFGGQLAAPILFDAFGALKPQVDRLPPPPAEALLVSHSQLPEPLKKFRSRSAAFEPKANAPKLAFPPDGARLDAIGDGIFVKVKDGTAPFTWLVNGAPILTQSHDRAPVLDASGRGFVTLSVIDAEGRAARSRVRLD